MGDGGVATGGGNQSHVLFDRFTQATTCKGTLKAFQELCDFLDLRPTDSRIFYHKLKSRLNYWKAKALWAKLDKRACHKEYKKGRACANSKCLIIGAGPCGLRTAIELAFLGAKVVLLEKRDAFSRNNVLHLWPFTIQDLRGLGAKKFYGKFCAGAIDHISIRQLQLILLKMALLLGIEVHVNVEFKKLVEPPEDQENERIGWRAEVLPQTHPVNEFEFDVIIGADGRRNTLPGFRRKEFRGKLAIAITANFINRHTSAEAKVEEISGVAFIFNQKFFQDLREATGVDLENIVYYKDDTHYFVMTAKKQSLLEKGVILHDSTETANASLSPPAGLRGHRAAALARERGPGGPALLRLRGGRLLHQPPAALAGLRHQPLRPAGRGHVRLHLHVRLGERRPGAPAQRAPAAAHPGGGQPAGAVLAHGHWDCTWVSGSDGLSLDGAELGAGEGCAGRPL
ncbi:protein-methionine sulfoxide oxidase mical3b isoform X4 [Anguilla rostrata]|uniref:protein-methionine sulfoxide oxidase mical3b isoform X4 n=1 Tax=Anguilla rostrata TaxID=7938 RepID=UPI0030D18373